MASPRPTIVRAMNINMKVVASPHVNVASAQQIMPIEIIRVRFPKSAAQAIGIAAIT